MNNETITMNDISFIRLLTHTSKLNIISKEMSDYIHDFVTCFVAQMKNPTVDVKILREARSLIFDFCYNYECAYTASVNSIFKSAINETACTKGFFQIIELLKEEHIKSGSTSFFQTEIHHYQQFYKDISDQSLKYNMYQDLFNVFHKIRNNDELSCILHMDDLDFLIMHIDEMTHFKYKQGISNLFRDNILFLLNMNDLFFENQSEDHFLKIIKKTPNNSVALNEEQLIRFASLIYQEGKDHHLIKELLRTTNCEQTINRIQKRKKIKTNKDISYLKGQLIKKTLLDIFNIDAEVPYKINKIDFFDFDLKSQQFLIRHFNDEYKIRQVVENIKEDKTFQLTDNGVSIDENQQDIVVLSYKI